jgi:hypothetical protein
VSSSVDGQQYGQSFGAQPPASGPPVKQGHLFVAAAKDYEMLQDYAEVGGKFRAYDAEKGVLKFRFEVERASKEHRDEFEKLQTKYKDDLRRLEDRYRTLQVEQQRANAIRNIQQKNAQLQNINGQMQNLLGDTRNLDQNARDAVKSMEIVRDYIDFELLVEKDAPIRKMWSPKVFDDKGKQRDMTTEERAKFKGDAKLPGWLAKLDAFEVGTPLKIKLKHRISTKEPEPEPEPAPATTTPTTPPTTPPGTVPPGVGGPAKDDPATKKREIKLEDRALIKQVIAESDPNAPTKKK